jgi:hypothetical protein
MTGNCYYQVNATPFNFQRALRIPGKLSSPGNSFQQAANSISSLRTLGLVLSHFTENTNLSSQNHSRVANSNTLRSGDSKQAGRFLAEGPLASHPYSVAVTVLASFYPRRRSRITPPSLRCHLHTSFTFVRAISNPTSAKNEMQAFFCPPQKILSAASQHRFTSLFRV